VSPRGNNRPAKFWGGGPVCLTTRGVGATSSRGVSVCLSWGGCFPRGCPFGRVTSWGQHPFSVARDIGGHTLGIRLILGATRGYGFPPFFSGKIIAPGARPCAPARGMAPQSWAPTPFRSPWRVSPRLARVKGGQNFLDALGSGPLGFLNTWEFPNATGASWSRCLQPAASPTGRLERLAPCFYPGQGLNSSVPFNTPALCLLTAPFGIRLPAFQAGPGFLPHPFQPRTARLAPSFPIRSSGPSLRIPRWPEPGLNCRPAPAVPGVGLAGQLALGRFSAPLALARG